MPIPLASKLLGPGATTVIDVGARWGNADSWFRLRPLARMVGFEPDQVECARLNAEADQQQEWYVPLALGKQVGTATLHTTVDPACASLYPPDESLCTRYPSLHVMRPGHEVEVRTTTLDAWFDSERDRVREIAFVKLDTQGAELDVLQGAERTLAGCLGIEAEVMFNPLYRDQPLFGDVDRFLRDRGFVLWRLDSLAHYSEQPPRLLHHSGMTSYFDSEAAHVRSAPGRLFWANALYFRDYTTLCCDDGGRGLLLLAALLSASGDGPAAEACLSRWRQETRVNAGPP